MSLEEHSIMAIILAAGKGSRMKSETPKVLSLLNKKPLVDYVLESLFKISLIQKVVLVVGYKKELVIQNCNKYNVEYSYQQEQKGTADALLSAKEQIVKFKGSILVTCGDMPLISSCSFERIIDFHNKHNSDMTILSANFQKPQGYGRIVRNSSGVVESIIEEKDASKLQKNITEVNTGTYLFNTKRLLAYLSEIEAINQQNEYYLTDLAKIYYQNNLSVNSICLENENESLGINSKDDLLYAEKILGNLSHI